MEKKNVFFGLAVFATVESKTKYFQNYFTLNGPDVLFVCTKNSQIDWPVNLLLHQMLFVSWISAKIWHMIYFVKKAVDAILDLIYRGIHYFP